MSDKKLTDEEIIKALECHINAEDCVGCEMFGRCDEIILTKLVLDLINRQKSEIERLKSELSNTRRKALLEASSKFAGHSNYHGDTILCKLICMAEGQEVGIAIPLDMSEMKANAYKEFAERIRECCDLNNDLSADAWLSVTADINCVLKEMTGEQ